MVVTQTHRHTRFIDPVHDRHLSFLRKMCVAITPAAFPHCENTYMISAEEKWLYRLHKRE